MPVPVPLPVPVGLGGAGDANEKCGVCNKVMRSAKKTLPCGHTSHSKCLEQYVFAMSDGKVLLTDRERQSRSLKCPTCPVLLSEVTICELFSHSIDQYIDQRQHRLLLEPKPIAGLNAVAPEDQKQDGTRI